MTRVLLVDDSAVARRVAKLALERRGVEVIEASSRADALRAIDDGVDGALLDLELGDGSGVDVARAVLERRRAVPFVFVTSATDEATLAGARALGPVFHKPEQVEAAVDALVRAG